MQVGRRKLQVSARVAAGAEREELWRACNEQYGGLRRIHHLDGAHAVGLGARAAPGGRREPRAGPATGRGRRGRRHRLDQGTAGGHRRHRPARPHLREPPEAAARIRRRSGLARGKVANGLTAGDSWPGRAASARPPSSAGRIRRCARPPRGTHLPAPRGDRRRRPRRASPVPTACTSAASRATLFEAHPHRVGGRCWTAREFGAAQTAEHGGEFIDTVQHRIRALAAELV